MTKEKFKNRRFISGIVTVILTWVVSYFIFGLNLMKIGFSGVATIASAYFGQLLYEGYMRIRHPGVVKNLFINKYDERAQMITNKTSSMFIELIMPSSLLLLVYFDYIGDESKGVVVAGMMLYGMVLYMMINLYYKRKN